MKMTIIFTFKFFLLRCINYKNNLYFNDHFKMHNNANGFYYHLLLFRLCGFTIAILTIISMILHYDF